MRILICHGYLLRGTGSNQYVQSLSRSLCKQGHNILVMCQESDPSLDFVTAYMREESSGSGAELIWQQETEYEGTCMVYQPDIGGLLPVYVEDSYPGFRVKEFVDLDEAELDWYIDRNRHAIERIVEQFAPAAIHTNHAVMLPFIARPVAEKAGVPYYISIHGSAIEYTVKRDERYVRYGAEGLEGARTVFVPSDHTAGQVMDVFGGIVEGLQDKLYTLPPGVDTDLFALADCDLKESVERLCEAVATRTRGVKVGNFRRGDDESEDLMDDESDISDAIAMINAVHPDWLPDEDLTAKLKEFAQSPQPFVMFLGKLLETKGIQCVLSALPLILKEHPEARLVIVGFGELRGICELMLNALDEGDVETLRTLCDYGSRHYSLAAGGFNPVREFLEELDSAGDLVSYAEACRQCGLKESVLFTGYLAPEEHRYILPHARAMLVTSLAQEAFGLVATEAMAAGVVPIASYHSGLETALEPVRRIWGKDAQVLLLGTREGFVPNISSACCFALDMPREELEARGREMREAVKETFSWDAVARRLVEVMQAGVRDAEGDVTTEE